MQQALEEALARIARQPVTVNCAGRTDTGVHAAAQVCHFDEPVARPLRAWSFGVNSHLDAGVAVHWAEAVAPDFHARFSAVSRSYRYTILNRATRPGLDAGRVGWIREPLDADLMHRAAQALVGEHDFQSFRAAECQAKHAVRSVLGIRVSRQGPQVTIDISANGFLHNMVRIVTGCLVAVGRGDRSPGWVAEVLAARDRTHGAATAPPGGLVFVQPGYPERFGIPDFSDEQRAVWRPE